MRIARGSREHDDARHDLVDGFAHGAIVTWPSVERSCVATRVGHTTTAGVHVGGARHAGPMTSAVALLRGINVGGIRRVPMVELRAVVEAVGHTRVATLLNSGNAVFLTRHDSAAHAGDQDIALAAELAAGLRARCGFDVDVVVRTGAEIDGVIAASPFPEAARDDPAHLVVMFHATPLSVSSDFDAARYGPEQVVWTRTEAYVHYPGRHRPLPAHAGRAHPGRRSGRDWPQLAHRARVA